jgi:hypothetical protein
MIQELKQISFVWLIPGNLHRRNGPEVSLSISGESSKRLTEMMDPT